jgi:hypothetical protein
MTPRRFLAMLAVALFGCRDAARAPATALVRDSAGVRIVDNRGEPGRIGWRVSPKAAVDVGGDPESRLFRVMSAARLSDGRIVAANSGSSTLEVFAADGTHLQTIGRAGDGPGEFRALFWVARAAGDSILGWDSGLSRLSVFAPDGRFVRTVAPRQPLGLFPQAAGVLGDGRVLIAVRDGRLTAGSGTSVQRDSVSYVTLGPAGEVQPLARLPGTEMLVSMERGFVMRPLPFGRQTVAAVHANRAYLGTGDRFEISAYEPGRGVRSIVRAEHAPRRVTPAEIREYQRSLVTLGAEGDARARGLDRQLLAEAPYPREMPPFTDLKVDLDGNLWVQAAASPSSPEVRWTVFAPDGRARGVVTLPGDLSVQEIGRDWVLGLAVDQNQLQHLRVYRLERRG